ncbi:hypothetical protein [Streptomyces sp. S063]|uniref:hypothetical protein n=1 Tax=Streptomyces sp. S063 TaxID=2005885 RepID=UPI001008266A|nr:hypothetical protein [Streptomyces sp. S063]
MTASLNLPVYLRVGSTPEVRLGDFTVDLDGEGTLKYGRPELAQLLRAAADEIENPSRDEGGDDAAADG